MVRDPSIVSPSLAIAAHSHSPSPSVSLAQRPARTRRLSLAQRELALSLAQRLRNTILARQQALRAPQILGYFFPGFFELVKTSKQV